MKDKIMKLLNHENEVNVIYQTGKHTLRSDDRPNIVDWPTTFVEKGTWT